MAHRMVGQTSKFDLMRPISSQLKCRGWPEIEFEISKKVDKKTFYFVNSAFSNVMRSAPKSQTPTFDSPLDASRSEVSSAVRIIAARETCEILAPHFWKRDEMIEFWAKWVHKVPKSCQSSDCTPAKQQHFQQLNPYSGSFLSLFGPILLPVSEKSPHRLSKVSHFFDLSCAGKLWSWRIEWRAKRRNLT